jgi:ABC-type Mn2+/Zn2+ transport system permease subunit
MNINKSNCCLDTSRRMYWLTSIICTIIPLFTIVLTGLGWAVALGWHERISPYYSDFCMYFIISICFSSPFGGILVAFYTFFFTKSSSSLMGKIWKIVIGMLLILNCSIVLYYFYYLVYYWVFLKQ